MPPSQWPSVYLIFMDETNVGTVGSPEGALESSLLDSSTAQVDICCSVNMFVSGRCGGARPDQPVISWPVSSPKQEAPVVVRLPVEMLAGGHSSYSHRMATDISALSP